MYDFTPEDKKAYKIKNDKLHGFIPMATFDHISYSENECSPHANDITMIAEVDVIYDREESCPIRKSNGWTRNEITTLNGVKASKITITNLYCYGEDYTPRFKTQKAFDRSTTFMFETPVTLQLSTCITNASGILNIANRIYPTREAAELRVFGEPTPYKFIVRKAETLTTDVLDQELYLPFTCHSWSSTENGFIVFKPCTDAHIVKIGDNVIADKVVPIQFLIGKNVHTSLGSPTYRYNPLAAYRETREFSRTPTFGDPIRYRFGMCFRTEHNVNLRNMRRVDDLAQIR